MLLNTQTLRSIIAGDSPIDLPALSLRSREDALCFLEAYGVRMADERDALRAQSIREQAIQLLEARILRGAEAIPEAVRALDDVPQLLLWASNIGLGPGLGAAEAKRRQVWACVVLRVCHTLSHARNELNEMYAPAIRQQIEARFERHLVRTAAGLRLGTGDDSVPLVAFEVRPMKTVEAATLKLLRAAENVAASIFDWMGVRIVTHDELDAVLTVRYLRTHHVIGFPNILPGRSRNSLVDLKELEPLLPGLEAGDGSLAERIAEVRKLAQGRRSTTSHQAHNVHSASSYRAIQFTCREMVSLPIGPGDATSRFFFPYEVQVLDAASYANSRGGPASHASYKRRQIEAVRARVLAGTRVDS